MSVELLQTLSIVSYVLAGVFLVISVVLFFVLDVRKLIGDISGANARKAIEIIRQQNENSGDKAYKPSHVNLARGRLTDKISPSGRLLQKSNRLGGSPGTQKFATTELLPMGEGTTLLENPAKETTLLTTELGPSNETTVLYQNENDSEILPMETASSSIFTVDVEMSFTGSSEVIE